MDQRCLPLFLLLGGLCVGLLPACTETDPLYCDAVTPCETGFVCDYGRRECTRTREAGLDLSADRGALEAGTEDLSPDATPDTGAADGSAADGSAEAGGGDAGDAATAQ